MQVGGLTQGFLICLNPSSKIVSLPLSISALVMFIFMSGSMPFLIFRPFLSNLFIRKNQYSLRNVIILDSFLPITIFKLKILLKGGFILNNCISMKVFLFVKLFVGQNI